MQAPVRAAVLTPKERLERARCERRARAELADELYADQFLDVLGLTEQKAIELAIGPVAREKLKGIIGRLRTKKHSFTTCMRDLRKHKPDWSDDRRKRTCAVLKRAAKGSVNASESVALAEEVCPMLSDDMGALLEHADIDALDLAEQAGKS